MADKNGQQHYALGVYTTDSIEPYYYGGGQPRVHEETSRHYSGDRKGTYVSSTEKSMVSTGERVVNKSSGQVGYKDEYKVSQSVWMSDKSSGSYTKYSVVEKYQRFNYGNNK